MNFQVIVPSLLVVLQEGDVSLRGAAMDCLGAVSAGEGGKNASIYAFDGLYGSFSGVSSLKLHVPVCLLMVLICRPTAISRSS